MKDKVKGGKILVADDEPAIRSLVRSMLDKDYSVIGASDGQEAINTARMQRPDLILMDIMMPKVDGYIACYTIKSDPALKDIPVVMLTGIGHELNMKLSQKFGADDYLKKPFRLQELKEVVIKYLPNK
jgi:two-component system alkaline phosphatase synthesis response regulator PhoP